MEGQFNTNNHFDSEKDLLDSFDLERFWYVFKRSKFWIVGFIFLATLLAYVYVRYTKPTYKSESIIKLDFESEANVLGLADAMNTQDMNEISGEIELIKSRLFLSKVVEAAGLDVSYHVYGRYLTDERYGNSPFIVSYKVHKEALYDRPLDVEIVSENAFILEYELGKSKISNQYQFGEEISTDHINLLVQKTPYFKDVIGDQFFFTINSNEALIDYLQETLEVVPENFNAKTIKISLSDHKASKARDLVALIDSLYLDYTKEVKNQAIEQKIDFLDRQIQQTEEKLTEYEAYFEEFTIENRTTDLDEDLNRTIMQLSLLDSQRYNLRSRLADINLLDQQIKEKGPIILNPLTAEYFPKTLMEALEVYSEVQQERELKLASYNETSYLIKQLDLKMDKAQESLDGIMKAFLETLNDRLEQVNRRRELLESNLSQLPSMGTEYAKNRRFYGLQEEFMLNLQTSKMELEITRAGTVTRSVVLSPASLPVVPVKPQKVLIIAAGFMVGLIFSVVFLLIRYLAHNKVAGIRELEKLVKVPVLGAVPSMKKNMKEHASLVVHKDDSSSIGEALRTIRTNLDFIQGTNEMKVVSVTSTISGEGKTFVAANLGAIMALTGKRVCVVDIDMRKPKIHKVFANGNGKDGMSTVLAGKSKLKTSIKETSIENLYYLSAGPTPPNPSELLLQETFSNVLKDLRKKYDLVILDTPPVGLVTDARLVMKNSDIQLYIVRADYSKRSFTKVLNDLKDSGQFSNLTTILNGIDNTPVYGYGYGYGHGYYEEEKSKRKKIASSLRSLF
ncbi:MAG: tyrosine-protein kinase [Ekhidna sp.]